MSQCKFLGAVPHGEGSRILYTCGHLAAARLKPGKDYILYLIRCTQQGQCAKYQNRDTVDMKSLTSYIEATIHYTSPHQAHEINRAAV